MVGLTNEDIHAGPNSDFCYGWAKYTDKVGAFSFHRYNPAFDGIKDPNRTKNLLMRSCHVLVRELCHMLGLPHCVYYECLMNGIKNAKEQRQGGVRVLCPVCLKKLKQNLKFDTESRFIALAEVCEGLGFKEEAQIYNSFVDASFIDQ